MEQKPTDDRPDEASTKHILDALESIIAERKNADTAHSYVAQLVQGDENQLLKKVVEEAAEFALAAKSEGNDEIIHEAADLLFHLLVALARYNLPFDHVLLALNRRFGISGLTEKALRTADNSR